MKGSVGIWGSVVPTCASTSGGAGSLTWRFSLYITTKTYTTHIDGLQRQLKPCPLDIMQSHADVTGDEAIRRGHNIVKITVEILHRTSV